MNHGIFGSSNKMSLYETENYLVFRLNFLNRVLLGIATLGLCIVGVLVSPDFLMNAYFFGVSIFIATLVMTYSRAVILDKKKKEVGVAWTLLNLPISSLKYPFSSVVKTELEEIDKLTAGVELPIKSKHYKLLLEMKDDFGSLFVDESVDKELMNVYKEKVDSCLKEK